jgi:hypothetical protein
MTFSKAERATPRDATGGSQEVAKLASLCAPDTATSDIGQDSRTRARGKRRLTARRLHLALGFELLGTVDPATVAALAATAANLFWARP